MAIKEITVHNFRSFEKFSVELGKFNVFIGANASGKSNFVQVFQFLRDISKIGLNNAISMQGGAEYLTNLNIGKSKELSVNIVSTRPTKRIRKKEGKLIGLEVRNSTYEFIIQFTGLRPRFKIPKDTVCQELSVYELKSKNGKIKRGRECGTVIVNILHQGEEIKLDIQKKPKNLPINDSDVFPWVTQKLLPFEATGEGRISQRLMVQMPFFLPPFGPIPEISMKDNFIYNFDPSLPKKATSIAGKAELEQDGNNLAIILRNIIQREKSRKEFLNVLNDTLPFVTGLKVRTMLDKTALPVLEEIYSKLPLPASMVSDGTITLVALIVALHFEKSPLTIIEEPGRCVHPYLISKIVDMMKDVSRNKQIIATTHNPEIVKWTDLENILLVSRDQKGFSVISKPADRDDIQTFLKDKIGLEELYISNILEP